MSESNKLADIISLKIRGKFTFPSEFSEVPEGSLSVARNVNLDRDSTLEPRRGFELEASLADINKIFEYQSKVIIHSGTNKLSYIDNGTVTDYSGSFEPVDADFRVQSTQASQNFYFTTNEGIKKLSSFDSQPTITGVPKAINNEATLVGTSGFLDDTESVAYSVVWGRQDPNGNLLLGAPSERLIVNNSAGGSRNVELTVFIPDGITESYFFQVYRSVAASEPSAELQQCYESFLTSGDITAGEITFIDNLPEVMLGATIYTAPSQEGIGQANELPPLARDIETFKGHTFFSNTSSKHRRIISILAADGGMTPGEALQIGDVITIAGTDFTGAAATDTSSNEFLVSTSVSPAVAIRETAVELCKVINKADIDVYAYYISGFGDVAGKVLIEAKNPSVPSFSITYTPNSHSGNPFSPQLPPSGNGVSSSNDRFKNGLYFSKFQEPEAVPILNFFRVGSADDDIIRISSLRDSLFIFMRRGGVFRLSGEDPSSFRIDEFDSTVRIIGAETLVKLNNAIYFLSDQGIVMCTETGITVLSRPIENEILDVFNVTTDLSAANKYSVGCAYETERKYLLAVPTTDDTANKIIVYNTFTRAFTDWDGFNVRQMFVPSSEGKILLASNDLLYKERKTYTSFDFVDYQSVETITNINSPTELVMTQVDTVSEGDVLYQSDSKFSVIKNIDTVTNTVTTYFGGGLTADPVTVYRAIDTEIRWLPFHGNRPHTLKQFSEISFVFGSNFLLKAEATFSTEVSLANELVELTGSDVNLWGFFDWGTLSWGGRTGRRGERTYVPTAKARANMLTVGFKHRIGFSYFKLNGVAVWLKETTQRFSK